MRLIRPAGFAALLVVLSLAPFTFAQVQTQSGNIVGRVTSGTDALPGVSVTLTGIGAPQTFVTTNEGDYRFLNLHPGRYTVTAELSGFAVTKRTVDVEISRNTEVPLSMQAAASESITVQAAAPVLDTRQTESGATIDRTELENVPTARDPWVVLQSVPGVLVDRVNVGGNESGQQSYFIGKGVERDQTEWNVDGVAVTDMAATGTSAFYYDFDSFDEMQVSTGGADPSIRTPGVHLNMVTKRGTNEISGSGRWFWTDKSFQSKAVVPEEARDYLDLGSNSIDHIDDYGLEGGGPLVRDKVWAWGAYSRNSIGNFITGNTDAALQQTEITNWNGKLNGQLTAKNSADVFFMWNNKTVAGRGLGAGRPIETASNQSGPGSILKFEDTQVFSQNLYVTGSFSSIRNGYRLDPIGGMDVPAYWVEGDGWHNSYHNYVQQTPQKNTRLDGSAYLKMGGTDHELRFGFGYRDTPVRSETAYPGNASFGNFYDGYALAAMTRPAEPNFGSHYLDAYVGDTVVLGNVTLTGGLRFDRQSAKNFGSSVPANPVIPDILPAVTYAGDDRALEWNGISPRLGINWSFGADRRNLLRTSYSRYLDQLGSSDAGSSNPFYKVQMLYYYWNDLNDDKAVQRNELDFDYGIYSWANIDPDNTAAGFSPGRLDYNMKAPTTDELIVGYERELAPTFSVGATYTYRYRTNFLWDQYEKTRGSNDFYTSADYTLAGTAAGTLPDGTPYSVPYYKLASGVPAPVYFVTTNRPDYHQTYNGIDLTATKRMSNHWMMRGSLTLSDWKQHVGPNGFVNPTPIVSGDSCTSCDGDVVASSGGIGGYINSRWSYSLNSVVELPWKFSLGAAVIGREGFIIPYYRRIKPSSATGNQNIMVSESFGANRLPDVFNLDLRIAKDVPLRAGVAMNFSLDLFNATNQRTVQWRDNRMYVANGSDSDNNWIEQLQSPRVWRLGARVRF
jgi:hypothetical protein